MDFQADRFQWFKNINDTEILGDKSKNFVKQLLVITRRRES